ncbi:hypothetical protein E2R51_01445 [Jeotgalibacillus sp. S-D1]|uniref:hypothetical protein n=1 Tax=Jeotgalibacillus sp. S-D1 TaxID=2552189 RepID=UPI001059B647|nr:hypothetical protein [Jeotgalibacillus sp. S-D1]TDL34407.1 hypothetical protein E2R51_01445 [Jeotgalibacillus sp. S-D1]
MEPSKSDHKEQESSSVENQPSKNAVIYFPKVERKNIEKGIRKARYWIARTKPVLLAALVSTVFATIAFTVIDPNAISQPSLTDQANPAVQQVSAGSGAVKAAVPDQTMWVVQAGVFKEAASAEGIFTKIESKIPVIQTSHDGLFALWAGAAADEPGAKAIAERHQSEEIPLYVKKVSRPAFEIELSKSDSAWLLASIGAAQPFLSKENAIIPDDLLAKKPESESLHPLFDSLKRLKETPVESTVQHDKAVLQVMETIWELPEKNS